MCADASRYIVREVDGGAEGVHLVVNLVLKARSSAEKRSRSAESSSSSAAAASSASSLALRPALRSFILRNARVHGSRLDGKARVWKVYISA